MSQNFAIVYEAEADFDIATNLADRALIDAIDWLDDDVIDHQRAWIHTDPTGCRLTWAQVAKLARAANIRAWGHFDGQPGLPDAAAARRALRYVHLRFPDVAAVLLIRDQDNQPARRGGLEQARSESHAAIHIVIGVAVVERESWVLTGFEPDLDKPDELHRLESERQSLGFDPCLRSHELTASADDQAKRSAKRVLRALTASSRERESTCWRVTPLATLEVRGADNGLADYLGEVRMRLVPLVVGSAGRPTSKR